MNKDAFDLFARLKALNRIGIALSAEKDSTRLLEMILEEAKRLALADGGTLYTCTEDNYLKFEIMLTDSLRIKKGGTSGEPVPFAPLPLYNKEGEPNLQMVAVCAAVRGVTINIPNAYTNTEFDFVGTRDFDEQTGYHSQSFLTVPMKNRKGEVIGILQLINALDPKTQRITVFSPFEQELVESLASQAAVALVNQQLLEGQRLLFEAFIELIAKAIDDKSPYTGGHCRRVPELTMLLAKAAAQVETGALKDFSMTEEDYYALKVASWLHDCGKITTPEHIIDKSTKLETIFDRIELIDTRFEILKRDAEITLLRKQLHGQQTENLEKQLIDQKKILDEERDFLRNCNLGSEWMAETLKTRVKTIGQHRWINAQGQEDQLLSTNEIDNLTITSGTLTTEERTVINNHIVTTINMLESLPYPKLLKQVPEFAGGHHEHIDGSGYPKGLTGEQMSVQARVMAIADIFEALTARDRPYKKPMPLSKALNILKNMKDKQHIDPDLFDIFIREKIYLHYAKKFLDPEQIDEIDLAQLLNEPLL
ncbi:MAG: phosphohydrolase [Beggiatoa sp. IS2]|nr:MAG: phosphohydrolase [Beggiatoa sp. IS2]